MVALEAAGPQQRPFSAIPQVRGGLLRGVLPEFSSDPIGMFDRMLREQGDLVRMRIGPVDYLMAARPDAIHHVLVENQKIYRKDTKGYQAMKKLLGEGLVTSNGDFWLRQRRIAQPGFHRERIQGFADTMVRCTEEMLEGWEEKARAGATVDVNEEMMALTLRIIGLTMMSIDFSKEAAAIGEALTVALHRTDELIKSLPGADLIPSARNLRWWRAKQILNDVVRQAIGDRRSAIERGEEVADDLLTMLLEARDPETGEGMDDKQLRDEVMTIFLAGHETTSNALTWSFKLLAEHPDVRERLQAELEAAGPGPYSLPDLKELPYTKQVIQESMRLYPPVWLIGRNSTEDDELGGHHVPAKTNVFLNIWLVHRHPGYWKDPETFDPDRFEGDPRLPKGLYVPFIEGPRQCIGKAFAMMEAHLLLANISRKVRLDLPAGHEVQLDPAITLRPLRGLPMKLSPCGKL